MIQAAGRVRFLGMPPLLLAAILGMVALRCVVAGATGLTDDEAYYRLWTLAPALSYLDHPPMAAWMMTLTRWVAGDSAFGLRLPSVLISLGGPFLLWRTAVILFDRPTAIAAVAFALVMPLLAVGGVIVTPDAPSVLFWGLTSWALAELYVSRNANWWLAVGLFAGLGLLSKYTNLIVGAGIVLWILLLPANRVWLTRWQLWAGGLIAALCTTPVIVWNAQHEWASFIKQFGRAVRGGGWTLTYLLELAGGYIGLASPIIAVLGIMGLWRMLRALRTGDGTAALIVTGLAPLLVYFCVHGLHSRVQANWVAPLYPTFALLGAHVLVTSNPRTRGRWAAAAVGLGALLTLLVYAHALRPFVVLPGSRDPTSQMRGWPEFAREVERLRVAHGAGWIAAGGYATTGQLAFALKGGAPVVQLTERIRYVHLPPVDPALLKTPALFVELEDAGMRGALDVRFRSVRPLGVLERSARGVALGRYAAYLVADPIAPETLLTYTPGRH